MKQSKHPRTDAFFAANKGPADDDNELVLRLCKLVRMCKEFEEGYNRYERIRILTPTQFQELWYKSMNTGIPFDELVDGLE